jgi:hypothetical protein
VAHVGTGWHTVSDCKKNRYDHNSLRVKDLRLPMRQHGMQEVARSTRVGSILLNSAIPTTYDTRIRSRKIVILMRWTPRWTLPREFS